MLCFIVVQLPSSKIPSAVKINDAKHEVCYCLVAKSCVYGGDPFLKTAQDSQGLRFLFVMHVYHFKEMETHFSSRNIRLGFRSVHGSQLSRKWGSPGILQPHGPSQTVIEIALPLLYCSCCFEYKVLLSSAFSFLPAQLSFQSLGVCSETVQRTQA